MFVVCLWCVCGVLRACQENRASRSLPRQVYILVFFTTCSKVFVEVFVRGWSVVSFCCFYRFGGVPERSLF